MPPNDRRFPLDKFMEGPGEFPIRQESGRDWFDPSKVPSRQSELIHIDSERDLISAEDGWWPMRSHEMHALLHGNRIRNVLVVGAALNICVLQRPFSAQAALTWGFNVAVMGDRTQAYVNPMNPPYVDIVTGHQMVLEYIQKFIVGSCSHEDVFRSARAADAELQSWPTTS